MEDQSDFRTPQEAFWAGSFGTEYIGRNADDKLLASNLNFFVKALGHTEIITSCLEFGANIGMNMKALKLLYPDSTLKGIEINSDAANELSEVIGKDNVFNGSIFEYAVSEQVDLIFDKRCFDPH